MKNGVDIYVKDTDIPRPHGNPSNVQFLLYATKKCSIKPGASCEVPVDLGCNITRDYKCIIGELSNSFDGLPLEVVPLELFFGEHKSLSVKIKHNGSLGRKDSTINFCDYREFPNNGLNVKNATILIKPGDLVGVLTIKELDYNSSLRRGR